MTAPVTLVLLAAADRAAGSDVGDAKIIGSDRPIARFVVDVSAVAAGGSVTVTVETARNINGGWTTVGTLTLTDTGAKELPLSGLQGLVRIRYTVAVANVSFGVTCTSDQCYCTAQNVAELSLPPATLAKVPAIEQAIACLAATDEAVSYLAAVYDMPLTSWGNALRLHCSNMAAYHAMKRRGMNPDTDTTIRLGYTDAIAWLKGAARSDPTIVDSTPTVSGQGPYVTSQLPRGWRQ